MAPGYKVFSNPMKTIVTSIIRHSYWSCLHKLSYNQSQFNLDLSNFGFMIHPHIWRFLKLGYPNSWMVYFMENPIDMDDLWVPLGLRKPPYILIQGGAPPVINWL